MEPFCFPVKGHKTSSDFVLGPSNELFKQTSTLHYIDYSNSPTASLMSISGLALDTMIIICVKSERSSLSSTVFSLAITRRVFPVLFHLRSLCVFHRKADAILNLFNLVVFFLTSYKTTPSSLLAHISLYFLRHHYLRRQIEEVASIPKEWNCRSLNADDQLFDILLLYWPPSSSKGATICRYLGWSTSNLFGSATLGSSGAMRRCLVRALGFNVIPNKMPDIFFLWPVDVL